MSPQNVYADRISSTLRNARKRAGLSARELAKRAGSSHSTILAYETGRKMPSTATFVRLIDACGFAVDFHLSPRIRGDASYPRGKELEDVMNLAAQFPADHDETLAYPLLFEQ